MNESHINFLEEQKRNLQASLDDIAKNMSFLDPASIEYKNLKKRSELCFSEIDEIENKLSEDQKSSLTNNRRGIVFDKNLRKIDFSSSKRTIYQILDKFGRDGVSAFFMIENIGSNRGDLLIREIYHSLSNLDNHIKHYQIDLLNNFIKNEESLLDAIAQFVPNAKKDKNVDNYASNIIDKVEGNLQPGSIIFFELNYWDALDGNQDSLLSWFINFFWIPLTEKHDRISRIYANVKILIFMTTASSLSKEMKSLPYFCNQSQFCHQKIFKLSLQRKWKQKDITEWIEDTYKYSRKDSVEESNKIFKLSLGNPLKTCLFLEDRFNKIASGINKL